MGELEDKSRDFLTRWMAAELPTVLADLERFSDLPRGAMGGARHTKTEAWGLLCHWLQRCAELELPPPQALARAAYLLADSPKLPAGSVSEARDCLPENAGAWRKAAIFESHQPADPEGEQPSVASVNALHQHTGASRDTIRRWREREIYRDVVAGLRQSRQE